VSEAFLEALRKHVSTPWQPVVAAGSHRCEFCSVISDGRFTRGSSNIWIPSEGVVYVAPELVLHYVEAHNYRPPAGFITAVLTCPDQGSDAYRALMRNFPAWWTGHLSST
jgi:hypothetical protein